MEFLAYAAHELRTPLATQQTLLEVALADPSTDATTWRVVGEDALGTCKELARLLEACLTLARGRDALQRREPIDLASLAGDALRSQVRPSLTTVAALEPARTSGDPNLVERLVANLVSNAIRHNIPDGRVDVTTRTASGRAVLSIANSGPLIAPAQVPLLFTPFNSNPDSRGVGLGLTIVRAVAELHDATVVARARARGGLGVDVSFPALD
jgi:signal transduction histidine kinase